MPNLRLADLTAEIEANVRRALAEDIGSGDITARLIPAERLAKATIITREAAVISGNLRWLRRGSVFEIEGKKIFAFGGAKSDESSLLR